MRSRLPATRWLLIAGAVAFLFLAGFLLPIDDWSRAAIDAMRDAGWRGALLYGAVYVVATIVGLPGLPLTLGAGFLYGPFLGLLLISPSSVLGATGAFLLARVLGRKRIARWLETHPRLSAIDAAARERAFTTTLLLRLSPIIPFNVLNYALGLSPVRLGPYVVASFLGMLPATLAYVWLGSLAPDLAALGTAEGPSGLRIGLLVTGVVATLVLTIVLGRAAQRELNRRQTK